MSLYIICAALFILSAVIILAVIVRKFRQLTLIDVEALPQERALQKKKEIIELRVARKVTSWWNRWREKAAGPIERVKEKFRGAYRRVQEIERQLTPKKPETPINVRERILQLIADAETLVKADRLAEAEKKYLEAAGLNVRNVTVYRGLADIYVRLKQWPQAKETLGFLVKIAAKSGCMHARVAYSQKWEIKGIQCSASQAEHAELARDYLVLGGVCHELGDFDCSRRAFASALVFEPANPRYLDLLLEACILVGDKAMALDTFAKLKEANPDNQKLPALYEKVVAIPLRTVPDKIKK